VTKRLTTDPTLRSASTPLSDIFGEPISVYTREQALADGVLVDVTAWASTGQTA
jgi:type I site-specific restriction endonuclease